MFQRRLPSALLVDYDNLPSKLGDAAPLLVENISRWVAWLEDGGFDAKARRRKFLTKRVYWNGLFDLHRRAFEAEGFEAFACRAAAKGKASSADIVITLDALDVVGELRGLKEVIILSADTDFVPVVNRLQQKGMRTVAGANETDASAAVYAEHADAVIRMADFRAAMTYERPKRGLLAKQSPKTPAPVPSSTVVLPPRQRQTRPVRAQSPPRPTEIDLEGAIARLATAADRSPGAPISRGTVERVLEGVPGFAKTGARPWLGFGSYRAMIEAVARRHPKLDIHKHPNGGVSLVARSPSDSPAA
jgi:hypothetical protein